jgi:hypothetical protein
VTLDARYPVTLLPVRIETRFAGSLLKVRIFPDEIFADTHEPGLTPDERTDGTAYLAAMHAGPDPEKDAWRQLVSRWTAPRAAFIVRAIIEGSTDSRAETWSRAAQASLPDHWVVRAYQGASVFTQTSKPVPRPLALTFDPGPNVDRVPLSDNLSIDRALKWTVDFAEAENSGMAVTIDLTSPDPGTPVPSAGSGVDLIVVVGVSEAQDPMKAAAQLRALFDAHHYTSGFAFLRPGTPTNNTLDLPSAFPPPDPNGTASYPIERGAPLVTPASAPNAHGLLLARALGLPLVAGEAVAAVEHIDGAGIDDDTPAATMNDALWPATLGYFMEQMMAPQFDAATIASARQFAVDHLRPGGPLPSFRVGRVPYGFLPTIALSRFAPDDQFTRVLRSLRDKYFLPVSEQAARVTASSDDPDGDLLKVLAVDASSRVVRMRVLFGDYATGNIATWLGSVAAAEHQLRTGHRLTRANTVLGSAGIAGNTRIGSLDSGSADERISGALVSRGTLSETVGLEGADGTGLNYIQWLHDNAISNFDAIRNDALPGTARPLLYRVLRHSLMVEMDRLAFGLLLGTHAVTPADRIEAELVRLEPAETRLTTYDRIARMIASPGFAARLAHYLTRLAALANLPTADLERRFTETLDACSHRLDAWITALASQKLWTLRTATPNGCHLGGFSWAEDVRPSEPAAAVSGGYIHAPSAAQASAAAILRNGFLSRGGTGSAYAVDLSSARVSEALRLLDGTRQGEPLAALLGYRFERDLHERQLEMLIFPLRDHFPLVAGKTPEGDGPTELVGGRNVVDGLALRRAWNDQTSPFDSPFDGTHGMPSLSSAQVDRFHDALNALNDAVDSVADVLTAESVFQAVRGNSMAAAASLDTMASGVSPPSLEFVRTPLSGVSFTQRLIVALAVTAVPPLGNWGARTPRATAEPFLDDWVGKLLGPPAEIGCTVRPASGSPHDIRLAALALRPLDFIALARTPPSALGDSELDRRVRVAAAAPADAKVDYTVSSGPHTFAQALEFARTIGELFAAARPVEPRDLVAPVDAGSATWADSQANGAVMRAQAALQQLNDAKTHLDQALTAVKTTLTDPANPLPTAAELATLRAALVGAAAFGVAGAYPPGGMDAAALVVAADGVSRELSARKAASPSLNVTGAAARIDVALDIVHAVFGRDFLFLPTVTAALAPPLADSVIGDANLPRQVLQQLARVRPSIGRWRSMWMYAQALGAAAPALEVMQLPQTSPITAWAGGSADVPSGTLSLILHRPTKAPPNQGWAAFLVDEWNETIPATTQRTTLSFRHETPVAEAPQAVLVAVPPTTAPAWDVETLIDTVRETLALAKIRAVDGALLDRLRPFLPAICLTGNTANEVVSTHFLNTLVAEPTIRSV